MCRASQGRTTSPRLLHNGWDQVCIRRILQIVHCAPIMGSNLCRSTFKFVMNFEIQVKTRMFETIRLILCAFGIHKNKLEHFISLILLFVGKVRDDYGALLYHKHFTTFRQILCTCDYMQFNPLKRGVQAVHYAYLACHVQKFSVQKLWKNKTLLIGPY